MTATLKKAAADSYMELIGEFPLRRINSVAAHARAKRLVLQLSTQPADRGILDYVDVLVDLIADYERRSEQNNGTANVSAAKLVRHRIEERGFTVSSLARLIGVPQSNLSEMLSGKRDWSKNAIRGLSVHLHIRADRFLS